ncbi:E2/UBC family protein [Azospirillum palustre]
MSGILTMQLEQLRERFGDVQSRSMASGTTLVTVPDVRLPEGWSKASTTIRFLVPPGYPFAQLDCFWADAELRLANGATPQNSAQNAIPETTEQGLWFSWHLTCPWNPNRDTLSTWMNVVTERMRQVR